MTREGYRVTGSASDPCTLQVEPAGMWSRLMAWLRCCPLLQPLRLDRHDWEAGEAHGGYREGVLFRCRTCGVTVARRPPLPFAPAREPRKPRRQRRPRRGAPVPQPDPGTVPR